MALISASTLSAADTVKGERKTILEVGNWEVYQFQDEFTGEVFDTGMINITKADETLNYVLMVDCDEKTMVAYFQAASGYKMYNPIKGAERAIARVKGKGKDVFTAVATGGIISAEFDAENTAIILKGIVGVKDTIIRFEYDSDYLGAGHQETLKFDVAGLDKIMSTVKECRL